MADLFDGYGATATAPAPGQAWDEMFGAPGSAREAYKEIHTALAQMTQEELRGRTEALASSYLAQGVTFDFAGEERPFPLDAVPRVIEQAEWAAVEAGIQQRVRALEAFLKDVYGEQSAVQDGVIPARLITSSSHFHREAANIEPANGVRIQVSGIDLIRDEAGAWRVLEDNVRVPSGVSYVISNRRVMAQTLPELFVPMRVRPVGDYPHQLLAALRASAPGGVDDPTVVVLTPGVYNSAYFEHTLLARLMGVELVEGRDLFCSGGRVWMRTTAGPTRVDVIYRRVDDEFLDPLQFRADSMLGSPACCSPRASAMSRSRTRSATASPTTSSSTPTCPTSSATTSARTRSSRTSTPGGWRSRARSRRCSTGCDELVVKPVDGSGGKGLVIGPAASKPSSRS